MMERISKMENSPPKRITLQRQVWCFLMLHNLSLTPKMLNWPDSVALLLWIGKKMKEIKIKSSIKEMAHSRPIVNIV